MTYFSGNDHPVNFVKTAVCGGSPHTNMLLLVDGSLSVDDDEWTKQSDFIKAVIDGLDVDRFSVGYVQFSHESVKQEN